MNILETDLHVHTVASGHAYNTVSELAAMADKCGLRAIAITDHGPGLPGGPHPFHFMNQSRFQKIDSKCRVFSGVEEDLADKHGNVHLDDFILADLDVVLVGNHPYGWTVKNSSSKITDSLIKAMYNPNINGITHPVNDWFEIDVKELVKNAKTSKTALEFNLSKVYGLEPKLIQFLEWMAEYDAPLMINSDAHIVNELGNYQTLTPFLGLIENINIVNETLEKTIDFFNID